MLQPGFPGVLPEGPPGRKVLWVPVQHGTAGLGVTGKHVTGTVSASNFAYATFQIPVDLGELLTAELIAIEFGSGSDFTVDVDFGKVNELRTAHSASKVVSIPSGSNKLRAGDIKSLFVDAEPGDIVGAKISDSFIDYFVGFLLTYNPE